MELCMHIKCIDRRERKLLTRMHDRWLVLPSSTSPITLHVTLLRRRTLISLPLPFTQPRC